MLPGPVISMVKVSGPSVFKSAIGAIVNDPVLPVIVKVPDTAEKSAVSVVVCFIVQVKTVPLVIPFVCTVQVDVPFSVIIPAIPSGRVAERISGGGVVVVGSTIKVDVSLTSILFILVKIGPDVLSLRTRMWIYSGPSVLKSSFIVLVNVPMLYTGGETLAEKLPVTEKLPEF